MNQYKIMRDRQHEEYAQESKAKYAYGRDQLRRMFSEWNLDFDDPADQQKVAQVAPGAFVLLDDLPGFLQLIKRLNKECSDAVAADDTGDGFIYDMFMMELADHEYTYTRSFQDTLDALGYTDEDLIDNPALRHGLQKAAADLIAGADEYEEEV